MTLDESYQTIMIPSAFDPDGDAFSTFIDLNPFKPTMIQDLATLTSSGNLKVKNSFILSSSKFSKDSDFNSESILNQLGLNSKF